MEPSSSSMPLTVEGVFIDFKGRRAGIIKALTTDFPKFYKKCDPDKENLCLFGLPNETWVVKQPSDNVPSDYPEPAIGINFARDGTKVKDWVTLIAFHCNSWLLATAFLYGSHSGFGKKEREMLFKMINELPTVNEVISRDDKQPKDKSATDSSTGERKSSKKMKSIIPSEPELSESSKEADESQEKNNDDDHDDVHDHDHDDVHDHDDDTPCGACGEISGSDEFWIFCDTCKRWFHGQCVNMNAKIAKYFRKYQCPICYRRKVSRRARRSRRPTTTKHSKKLN